MTQGEPSCLNVLLVRCNVPWLVEQVLPGAFKIWPDATMRPNLVSDAEIVRKQPVTIVYRIRQEARWSDGVPVTARDFEFTHQVRLEHPRVNEWHLNVRRVRAVGAKTVEVVLRSRWVDWRLLFDVVLPRHVAAGQDFESLWKDGIDNPRTRRAIGSGPFLFAGWQRGKQLTLVRNRRYWGPHPAYLDRVEFRFFPPQDTADLLRRGAIDMIENNSPVMQAQALELHRQRAPGIRIDSVLGASWEHFAIRQGPLGHPALRKRLVRQAIAYGIDRAIIAREAAALDLASAAASKPLDSVVSLAQSPYHERNWSAYRHRPAGRGSCSKGAGCRRGADGGHLRLRRQPALAPLRDDCGRTATGAHSQARAGSAAGGGDRGRPCLRAVLSGPQLGGQPHGARGLRRPPSREKVGSLTQGPANIFGCQQPRNYTGYCDRLVTRGLVNATQTLDDARRVGLLNRVDVRLARAVPAIPLFQTTFLDARKTSVRGVVQNGVGSWFWDSENWWLAE